MWSGMFVPDPDPGSGSWFFTHPGSRIKGSKNAPDPGTRIRNTGIQIRNTLNPGNNEDCWPGTWVLPVFWTMTSLCPGSSLRTRSSRNMSSGKYVLFLMVTHCCFYLLILWRKGPIYLMILPNGFKATDFQCKYCYSPEPEFLNG